MGFSQATNRSDSDVCYLPSSDPAKRGSGPSAISHLLFYGFSAVIFASAVGRTTLAPNTFRPLTASAKRFSGW